MKFRFFILFAFFLNVNIYAQGPRVPSVINFAGMELDLHDHVRREIQEEVDALHRSQKYFNIKLERVHLYFPIIERILREENVPDDFKYLVIQESALISDAISTSNAVGFWQFKIATAQEVGLRVDRNVDERLNITASTHGAAKYLKRNNFYFNNWLYALLSYNMGVGGANSEVDDKYFGAKKMSLKRRTHWYLIKFLAHKIAFENHLDNNPGKRLYEYTSGGGQSLKEIANNFGVDYEELQNYNKWLLRGKVPVDKIYTVIIPGLTSAPVVAKAAPVQRSDANNIAFISPNSNLYPKIKLVNEDSRIIKINGIKGIIANDGEDVKNLAALGGINLSKFLQFNEIDISHKVRGGTVYYLRSKKNKAGEHYHTVMPDEDLWSISQKYGVKKKKLIIKNRLEYENDIKPGMVLWLRYIRSEDQPVEYVQLPPSLLEQPASMTTVESEAIADEPADHSEVGQPVPDKLQEDEYEQLVDKYEKQPEMIEDYERSAETDIATMSPSPDPVGEESRIAQTSKNPLFHIIEAGETLYAVSRKYKIPVDDLLEFNDLNMDDKISIGQKIYLRQPFEENEYLARETGDSAADSYMTYTVKKGDTMYSISKKYNVSVESLVNWNNKKDYSLQEGEILKIKTSK